MTQNRKTAQLRTPFSQTAKTVAGLVALGGVGLLSNAWNASLVLFGLAILTPSFLSSMASLAAIAAAATASEDE